MCSFGDKKFQTNFIGDFFLQTFLTNLSKPCWYLEITCLVVELKECKKLKEVISKC